MTQRIFDTDNAEDMALLWSILPESITKITPIDKFLYTPDNGIFTSGIIKIDFHNKKEIVRPIQEATEADIGKLCKFWDKKRERESIGILCGFEYDGDFVDNHSWCWSHCRRLTKQEIEELC